ncbi:hypothetical protein KDA_63910 [Dictyobacter alpinus]|uniref:histidine kinase n=1 Tax=Dictyobacter alpinus TaxID=2014873 RepID=A0A402BI31_9CHLR|nr:PAS domain S-box protein [Dictyobacter alpinus]GCE30907.1 hypothetical protein KDA_63910 [Dictyobacter alpinus]
MQRGLRPTVQIHPYVDKLEALLEAIPDGVVKIDTVGRLQRANVTAQRLLTRIASLPLEDILRPDQVATLRARDVRGHLLTAETVPVARILRGEVLSGQGAPIIRFPITDGQELYLQISGAPLQNELAQLTGGVVILRDMTEYMQRRRYLEEMLLQGVIEQRRLREREERAYRIATLVPESSYPYQLRVAGHTIECVWTTEIFSRITGYSQAEVNAVGWFDESLYHPNDHPAVQARRQALLAGVSDVQEWRLLTKAGEVRWLRDSCHPVADETSGIFHFYGAVHDITRHKEEQDQIHQLSQQLSTIFAAITDCVVVYDREGHLLQMNRAAQDLGVFAVQSDYQALPLARRAQLLQLHDGRNALSLEQTPAYRVLHGESLKGSQAMDIFVCGLDGSQVCLNVTGAPLRDISDEIVGAVLIFRDVTARRQQEQRTQHALDALLAMAEALVHSNEQITFPDDVADQAAYISKQQVIQHLLMLVRDLLSGQRTLILTMDDSTQRFTPVAVAGFAPEQEEVFRVEIAQTCLSAYFSTETCELLLAGEAMLADMEDRPATNLPTYGISHMLVAPLYIAEHTLGVLIMDYPTNDQEYPVHEALTLLKAVGKLAAVVIERERLIHARIIAQARALSEGEANRQKDEFLHMVSHELRNPLATIKASIQLTRRQLQNFTTGSHNDDLLEQIESMLDRGERQVAVESRLIGDLLDGSRIQADQLKLQVKLCNLLDVVRNVIADLQTGNTSRVIQIIEPMDEDMIPVVADVERIGQVLTHYLANAMKYSPADKAITLQFQLDGQNVRVTISDEGPGILQELQTRIWEHFYQVPGRIVYSGSAGLGLGLSICQTIIRQHYGQVGVESRPGQGAAFWFTLPLARV